MDTVVVVVIVTAAEVTVEEVVIVTAGISSLSFIGVVKVLRVRDTALVIVVHRQHHLKPFVPFVKNLLLKTGRALRHSKGAFYTESASAVRRAGSLSRSKRTTLPRVLTRSSKGGMFPRTAPISTGSISVTSIFGHPSLVR